MQFLYTLFFSKGFFDLRIDQEGIQLEFCTDKNIAQNCVAPGNLRALQKTPNQVFEKIHLSIPRHNIKGIEIVFKKKQNKTNKQKKNQKTKHVGECYIDAL